MSAIENRFIALLTIGALITLLAALPALADSGEIERRDTVVFDLDGGPVTDPELWNPFMPGRRLVHGFHQVLMEPLFILNYETSEMEPWLAQSMTPNSEDT